MLNTKRPLLVVYVLFLLLLSMFTARTVISDTFKVFREGVVRDLQGIAEKQAEVIREYLKNEKKNIRVAAYDLHRYYATSDYMKPLNILSQFRIFIITKKLLLQIPQAMWFFPQMLIVPGQAYLPGNIFKRQKMEKHLFPILLVRKFQSRMKMASWS